MKYKKINHDVYNYELEEDITFNLDFHIPFEIKSKYYYCYQDTLVVFIGYRWDGASGIPDTDSTIIASLCHDAFYQMIRSRQLAKERQSDADRMFKNLMIENGSWEWYARLCELVLNRVGHFSCVPGSQKPDQMMYE